MKISKDEMIKEFIKKKKIAIGNFDLKVQTSALLMHFFKTKGYEFYFCPKLYFDESDTSKYVTPDFQAKKESKEDIIGEIKQSLPNPNGEHFDKKSAKDIEQLKKYSGELATISTPHTVFFAAPDRCAEAIDFYTRAIEKDEELKDKIAVIRYYTSGGDGHNRLAIGKIYGSFKDADIENELKYKSYQIGEGDLEKIQGTYKILYTEETHNGVPLEYVMTILWYNVIPEIISTSSKDKTIERIKTGENTITFTIDELKQILDNLYSLPTSDISQMSQFSKKMIIDSMKGFEKIDKARKLNDSETNPQYRVTFSLIVKQKTDLIDYLIRELNKENFEATAQTEINKKLNTKVGDFEVE